MLLVGLLGRKEAREQAVPALSLVVLAASLGLTIWQWGEEKSIVAGALRIDDLALVLNIDPDRRRRGHGAARVALARGARAPPTASGTRCC